MLVFIYINPKNDLSSNTIALSIHTNPSYVRQLMMPLKKAHLLNSVHGQAKPELTRDPNQITLLDVYRAIEKDKPLLHLDTNINPECNLGINIQYALKDYYQSIQSAAEAQMAQITLADIIAKFETLSANQPFNWD